MSNVFNISPSDLKLGAVLARGSPGVTLYQADLQIGDHTTKVKHPYVFHVVSLQLLLQMPILTVLCSGGCETPEHKQCPSLSRILISERDTELAAGFKHLSSGMPHAGPLQVGWRCMHCHDTVPKVSSKAA